MEVLAAMTRSSSGGSDEEFACRLLIEHLTKEGKSGFRCEMNSNEPPDLLVTWNDGVQWGVEVTRTYLQVPSVNRASTSSSAGVSEPLLHFGEELGEATKEIRKRDYFLSLGLSVFKQMGQMFGLAKGVFCSSFSCYAACR